MNKEIPLHDVITAIADVGTDPTGEARISCLKLLLERFGTQDDIDWTVALVGEKKIGTFPVFEQLDIADLGASKKVYEELIPKLIAIGAYHPAQSAVERAGRSFTTDEVARIAHHYVISAVVSDKAESDIAAIIRKEIGESGVASFKQQLATRESLFIPGA